MWHDAPIPHRSDLVGGQHSSTRAELAAVVMALQGTPRADDPAILIDSTAAIPRLRWFLSHDFRPAEHKVKDYDIIHDILRELKLRSESSSRTLFVKVHGHSGDPLHGEADRLAAEGADKESDDEDTLYPGGWGQGMVFNWVDDADESKSHTWCPTVKKCIKVHEEKMSWQTRSRKTHAEEFLVRPNAGCPQLCVALCFIWDWAVRTWMLSLAPGAISCQIEPHEIGTDSHCTMRLWTWGRNTSPPATSLSPYSSSKHETNCAQQRGKNNRKSGETYQSRDMTCSVGPKGPHFLDKLCQCK